MLGKLRRIRALVIFEALLTAGAAITAFVDPARIFAPLIDGPVPDGITLMGPWLGTCWLVMALFLRSLTKIRDAGALRVLLTGFALGDVLQLAALYTLVEACGSWGPAAYVHAGVGIVLALNRAQALLIADALASTAPADS
ncbi:MAG: hypothetical protein R3A51_12190 [Nannocystaceae bacterium]|nr:hypothetical protein [Myxococcales bacterium]